MENHHFNGKTHYKWPFSIAMLNYQRVFKKNRRITPPNSAAILQLFDFEGRVTAVTAVTAVFFDHGVARSYKVSKGIATSASTFHQKLDFDHLDLLGTSI